MRCDSRRAPGDAGRRLQKTRRYLPLLIAAGLIATAAFAADWNPGAGQFRRLLKDRIYLVGTVIGLEAHLKHRPGGADIEPGLLEPVTQAILTGDGRIWHLLANARGIEVLRNPRWQGARLRLHGWAYPEAQVFEIDSYVHMVRPGQEIPYRFCHDCRRMLPQILFGETPSPLALANRPTGQCRHRPPETMTASDTAPVSSAPDR